MTKTKESIKKSETIHKDHRSRMKETYLKVGFEAFSDIEKLEFILFYAISRKDTNPMAHKLIDTFGSFDKVLEAPIEALIKVDGLGEHSAILLNLFLKTISVYGKTKCATRIKGIQSAKEYASNLYTGSFVEEFYVVCLNTSNIIMTTKKINSGTSSEVNVEIRDITNLAINNNCERIILIHNHPTGAPYPSDEDLAFTSKILMSSMINNIEVLDHIIVTKKGSFSIEEAGILSELKREVIQKIPSTLFSKNKFGQNSTNYAE